MNNNNIQYLDVASVYFSAVNFRKDIFNSYIDFLVTNTRVNEKKRVTGTILLEIRLL